VIATVDRHFDGCHANPDPRAIIDTDPENNVICPDPGQSGVGRRHQSQSRGGLPSGRDDHPVPPPDGEQHSRQRAGGQSRRVRPDPGRRGQLRPLGRPAPPSGRADSRFPMERLAGTHARVRRTHVRLCRSLCHHGVCESLDATCLELRPLAVGRRPRSGACAPERTSNDTRVHAPRGTARARRWTHVAVHAPEARGGRSDHDAVHALGARLARPAALHPHAASRRTRPLHRRQEAVRTLSATGRADKRGVRDR
jgi:hypothetical protein